MHERHPRPSGLFALACLLPPLIGFAPASAVDREDEPVTVVGSSVPELTGEHVSDFGLFRYESASSSFVAIPYQVDERLIRTFDDEGVPAFSQNIYDVLREDDGRFDALDEIVFLFRDAGPAAPAATAWPAGADARRYEIRVSDPRPSNPEVDRYVYVFTGPGLSQSTTSYVTWDGQRNTPVTTDEMEIIYEDKWLLTGFRKLACGNGIDLIDRLKARAGAAPDRAETEEVWNSSAIYLGAGPPSFRRGISGPIRGIRYVRGAASGTNTVHHDKIYRRVWHRSFKLRVHPLSDIWHYLDWLPQSGLTLYSPDQRNGLPQEGSPDGPVDNPFVDWNLMRSPGGGMVFLYDIPASPFYGTKTNYLRDDQSYNDDPGQPANYGDEDDSAYGNHGFHLNTLTGSGVDAIDIEMKLWALCGDTGDANLGDEYQELEDFPLASTTAVQRDNPLVVDLSLTKDVDQPNPDVGSDVVFTTMVTNATGFDTATGVTVIDLMPSGYAYVSDDSGGTYDGVSGIWGVGTLAPGASASLNVTARVLGSGDYLNEAEVTTADQDDVDDSYADGAGEDYGAVSTVPNPRVDLSVVKTVDNPTPNVGSNVVFTITVANALDFSDATGVAVIDVLPSGYTYVNDDSAASGTAYDPATGMWSVGTVQDGQSINLRITATVNPGGDYDNVAELFAANEIDVDSTPGNGVTTEDDYDSASTTPNTGGGEADLSLSKTVDNPTPDVQTDVTFTITVSNAGPDDATGVEVTDLLPSGYAYVSDDSAGAYDSATGRWVVGTVTVSGSATLNIVATVLGSGDYTNTAEVTASDLFDPDSVPNNGVTTEDDWAQAATAPNMVIDLLLDMALDNPVPAVGTDVVFTLTVENAAGFSTATGVQAIDLLPSGYAYIGDDGGGAYDPATGLWAAGTVAAGSNRMLSITARVLGSGDYANTAEVTAADQPDIDSTPNNGIPTEDDYDSETSTPTPTIDLSLTKTVDNPLPTVGQNVVFTVATTNAVDFSDATGVEVTDLLPSGYAYVGDDSATTGTTYDPGTGVWTIGSLTAGGSIALNITATVLGSGGYTNVAEVTAANEPDSDSTPNNGVTTEDDYDEATTTPTGGGPEADLRLSKTVDNPTPDVGSEVVFSLMVSNDGPDGATGVQVTDLLPSGYSYVGDDSGGAYDPGSGVWSVGSVGGAASATLNLTATVRGTGDHVNTAEVTASNEADPDSTPNNGVSTEDDWAQAGTTPNAVIDLSLAKTVDDPAPSVGQNVVFTVTVQDHADFSDATGVQVTDLLPSGYSYVSDDSSSTGTAYDPGSGVWSVGPVAAGGSVALNITATVQATGDYTNTAEVTAASQPDVDSTPNNGVSTEDDYAEASTTPTQLSADLRLSKTVDNSTPAVGSDVTFSVTVTNDGPDGAAGVEVTDALPSGYLYASDDSGGSYDPGTGVWTVGPLASGSGATLNITATVRGTGDHTNTAEVTASSASDPDSTPGNGVTSEDDWAQAATTPDPVIDLSLTKIVDNATPDVGTDVVFTVTVSNDVDFSDATGVLVTDKLPTGYTYVTDDSASTGTTYNPNNGRWNIGALAAGSGIALNITATVDPTGNYTNSAEVTAAGQPDVDSTPNNGVTTEDDYDEATTTPNPVADLRLAKAVDDSTPSVGQDVIFSLTVTNDGPSGATGVQVTDLLPSGYSYVSDDSGATGTTYDPVTGLWDVGALSTPAAASLNITATVNASGNYTNTAEVTAANESDPDSTPNNGVTTEDDYAEASTTPSANSEADLRLSKTVDNPVPDVGTDVTFTLTVSNDGPDEGTGVEVTDLLPSGYGWVADDSGGSYDPATGLWTVGGVANGGSATLNITATVNASGNYTNTAEVTAANESDPDSTPNNGVTTEDDYAEVSTTPNAVADLSLGKVVDNSSPDVGSNVIFTLTVANSGPSDATGVAVTDLLPTGYTYVSDDSAGAYVPGTGVWTVGGITATGNAVLNITATVNASGNYTNTAEVTAAGESDPDSTPNNGVTTEDDYAEVSTTPNAVADLSLAKVVDNTAPDVGSNVVFTLTVTNAGPSDATGVAVTDLLPTGYTYVSDDSAGAYVPGTGVWTVGSLAASASSVLNITATVNASGNYTNTAEVTAAGESDPDSTPNNGVTTEDDYAEASTTPNGSGGGSIDLSLTKTVSNVAPDVGSNVDFTIAVTNATGADDATGVEVTDLLPSGYIYVGSGTSTGGYDASTGLWALGVLAAGGTEQLTISATVRGTGNYVNEAEVTAADQPDVDDVFGDGQGADHDSASVTPNPLLDLRLTKTVDDIGPDVGDNVTFTVTVFSHVDFSHATGLAVTDLLPSGYLFVSDDSASTGTTYTPNDGLWDIGNLAAGASITLNLVARVRATGNYRNEAEVTAADQADIDDVFGDGQGEDHDTAEPVPGSIRTLMSRKDGNDVVLSWQPVQGAVTYRVYYSEIAGEPRSGWSLLGEVDTTEYRDVDALGLAVNRHYSVVIFNPTSGEGPH